MKFNFNLSIIYTFNQYIILIIWSGDNEKIKFINVTKHLNIYTYKFYQQMRLALKLLITLFTFANCYLAQEIEVDVVYTWVDSSDPDWITEYE